MIRTTNPDKMKKEINALRPTGGGDYAEMCLSGLQVQHRLFAGQKHSSDYLLQ